MLQTFRKNLPLLMEMVRTDFKLRYQSSLLGYVWSLLKPLLMFVILYLVFSKFLRFGGEPLSLLLGIVTWNFFAEATNTSLKSIVNKGGLIRKLDLPKYVIVMASLLSALINLLISFGIVILFSVLFGSGITWTIILLPILLFELILFTYGISMFLAAVFVRVRDMNYLWELALQMGFYMVPIIYPLTLLRERLDREYVIDYMLLNPIVQMLQDLRAVITEPGTIQVYSRDLGVLTLLPFLIVLFVFIGGVQYFRRHSPSFAEDV